MVSNAWIEVAVEKEEAENRVELTTTTPLLEWFQSALLQ
jgi:hypothetical protein